MNKEKNPHIDVNVIGPDQSAHRCIDCLRMCGPHRRSVTWSREHTCRCTCSACMCAHKTHTVGWRYARARASPQTCVRNGLKHRRETNIIRLAHRLPTLPACPHAVQGQ